MRSRNCATMPHGCARRWRPRSRANGRRSCCSFRPFWREAAMSESSTASVRAWLAAPMNPDVAEAIERLRRAPDVQQIAVMPDVHLASDVCVGVVFATSSLIYPQAVGGDIGCGMLAVGLDLEAAALHGPRIAGQVLT